MSGLPPVVVGTGAAVAVMAAATTVRFGMTAQHARRARRRLRPGDGGWSGHVLDRARPPAVIATMLSDAGLDVGQDTVWRAWTAGTAGAGLAGMVLGGPALGGLAIAVAAAAPVLALALARGRGDRQLEAALPAALDAMARSLRSGASLLQTIDESGRSATDGRLATDLHGVVTVVETGGQAVVDALDQWAKARPLPGVRLAVAALAVAAESGGPPARAVEGVAATIRARLAVAAEIRSLGSQARYSAVVIGLAPIAFMALAAGTDGPTATFLFRTPLGLACLTTGLLLDGAGAVWMHRIAAVRAW